MLKSTHRSNANPLPAGWTEHRAPTGHLYFYNAETKQSTYTRPVATVEGEDIVIDYGATQPDREVQASMSAMQEFHKSNGADQQRLGHFTGGRSYQGRDREPRPNKQGDRAKTKMSIPNCHPWVLVKTKYGRRFVHNPETKESFWKFPSEVMMAVIDMDRAEWQNKQQQQIQADDTGSKPGPQHSNPTSNTRKAGESAAPADRQLEYDSDEYEEVEVTDEEDAAEDPASKRPKLDAPLFDPPAELSQTGPQEFDEDDIAWQLAQMDADEDDPGYDFDYDEDEDGGMPLTNEDRDALFRNLLDEFDISPFSTFDALIDTNTPTANAIIMDQRWAALPNMNSRRSAFVAWSRDRVAARKAAEAGSKDVAATGSEFVKRPSKTEPRVAYLRFLSQEATPKLYWPEFKRKFRKSPEMTDRYFADKDREKLYREYIAKLKTSESDRKKEFASLLKSITSDEWKEAAIPLTVERDLRFYGVRDAQSRKDMVEAYISTLPK